MHKAIPLLTKNTLFLYCKIPPVNADSEMMALYSYPYELHTYTAGAKCRSLSS